MEQKRCCTENTAPCSRGSARLRLRISRRGLRGGEGAKLGRRVASPVTATTDFLAPGILNKCDRAVPSKVVLPKGPMTREFDFRRGSAATSTAMSAHYLFQPCGFACPPRLLFPCPRPRCGSCLVIKRRQFTKLSSIWRAWGLLACVSALEMDFSGSKLLSARSSFASHCSI
jgi:hypothetical protein